MKLKTPLRYPGGKSRAIPKLCEWLPSRKITEYREPFLGGGSMALEMTKRLPEDVPIWVNDLYKPLINFWKALQTDGEPLTQMILDRKKQHPDQDSARKLFGEAKDILNDATQTSVDRAAAFT